MGHIQGTGIHRLVTMGIEMDSMSGTAVERREKRIRGGKLI